MADKRKGRKIVPEKLPRGTVLTDISKISWSVVEPIGAGGFGIIYSVRKDGTTGTATYAAKVEPHGNGPLFVERNFFLRNLKCEMIENWKKNMRLSFLGLPMYIGSGTYISGSKVDHRFLIMERFGDNINSRLRTAGESIDLNLLGTFCSQIVDSLAYIHSKGYVHMDIKPENLLLKYNSKNDQVYLIDFGIIDKYTTDPIFKPDKKKQHNGTLLYCSRDGHLGVGTMRGDLEILGYNILNWCGYELPWSKSLKNPSTVHQKKIHFMSNLESLKSEVPANVIKYLNYINELRHDQTPDYDYVKTLFDYFSRGKHLSKKSAEKRVYDVAGANSDKSDTDEGIVEHDRSKKLRIMKNKTKRSVKTVASETVPANKFSRVGRSTAKRK